MKNTLITVIMIIAATITQAKNLVFLDTFNTADNADINADITSRQSGGVLESAYAVNAYSTIVGNQMKRAGAGVLALNANLATYIAGRDFEISCNLIAGGTDAKWSALYLRSGSEENRGVAVFGFHAWETGILTVYHGIGAQSVNHLSVATLSTLLGTTYDQNSPHTIQLVSTAGAGGTNTCDFVVDGVVVLDDLVYKFGEDSLRSLEFVATTLATGGVYFDDLTLKSTFPVPGAVKLIGIGNPL